jgi:hypothetical protein
MDLRTFNDAVPIGMNELFGLIRQLPDDVLSPLERRLIRTVIDLKNELAVTEETWQRLNHSVDRARDYLAEVNTCECISDEDYYNLIDILEGITEDG